MLFEIRTPKMWPVILIVSTLSMVVRTEMIHDTGAHESRINPEATSIEHKMEYIDDDITVTNELVKDEEKSVALKHHQESWKHQIKPLGAEDLKCLVSVNRFCSEEMAKTKGAMIQAIKEDCKQCSQEEKVNAGKTIAAMMARDPVAWKLFLTRYAGRDLLERLRG